MSPRFIERVNAYLDHEIDDSDLAVLRDELAAEPEKREFFRRYKALYIASEAALTGLATIGEEDPEGKVIPLETARAPSRSWRRVLAYSGAGAAAAVLVLGFFVLPDATRYLNPTTDAPSALVTNESAAAVASTRVRSEIPAVAPLIKPMTIEDLFAELGLKIDPGPEVSLAGYVPNAMHPFPQKSSSRNRSILDELGIYPTSVDVGHLSSPVQEDRIPVSAPGFDLPEGYEFTQPIFFEDYEPSLTGDR